MESTALHWACYTGSTTVASFLLAKGASPSAKDATGMTPLHHAVESAIEKVGDCSLVRWLLVYGADPFITDNQGRSVLSTAKFLAASEIQLELVKILSNFSKSGETCRYFNTEPQIKNQSLWSSGGFLATL